MHSELRASTPPNEEIKQNLNHDIIITSNHLKYKEKKRQKVFQNILECQRIRSQSHN